MKVSYLYLLVLLVAITSCEQEEDFIPECVPTNLQGGVIAYYPFIGGSLEDESTNANDLTNPSTARPAPDRFGDANCAYQFENFPNSGERLINMNSGFLDGLNEFSISLWYQPLDTAAAVGLIEVLLGRGDQGRCPDRRGEWSVGLYDCRRAVFGHDNSVWADRVVQGSCGDEVIALTNKWHHVVATRNHDSYNIYFNGVLNDSESGIAGCTNQHIAQDIGDLFIGNYFTGKIDDILIYSRELSQDEVMELYELEPCCQ